jgi:hypothetical protein
MRPRVFQLSKVEVRMPRRWVLSLAGALVLVGTAVGVAALTGSFGGHRTHEVAQQARTTPSPFLLETPTPTPTPSPKPHRKHHVVASGHAAVQHGSSRSSRGRSAVPPADPCAHNHHCDVPPAPSLKPDPRPPIGPPVATVSGAVVPPPAAD